MRTRPHMDPHTPTPPGHRRPRNVPRRMGRCKTLWSDPRRCRTDPRHTARTRRHLRTRTAPAHTPSLSHSWTPPHRRTPHCTPHCTLRTSVPPWTHRCLLGSRCTHPLQDHSTGPAHTQPPCPSSTLHCTGIRRCSCQSRRPSSDRPPPQSGPRDTAPCTWPMPSRRWSRTGPQDSPHTCPTRSGSTCPRHTAPQWRWWSLRGRRSQASRGHCRTRWSIH
jgi:hypothetical protein